MESDITYRNTGLDMEQPSDKNKNNMNGKMDTDEEEHLDEATIKSTLFSIRKSLVACTFAYFLVFMGFIGLTIIQSTLVGPIGTIGLGCNFGASIFGCIVLAPLCVGLFGAKISMVIGKIGFLLWMVSNFYPTWGTVIPAAIISGMAFGPLFSAQGVYFAIQATRYAKLMKEKEDEVMARFFGIFFCLLLMGASVGCLVTSAIMSAFAEDIDISLIVNGTSEEINLDSMPGPRPFCGANYCPGRAQEDIVATNATEGTFSSAIPLSAITLVGTHTSAVVLGLILVTLFVDRLPKQERTVSAVQAAKESIIGTFKQLKRGRMLLLTVLNIYSGVSQSFVLADLTEAYIACAIGVELLGYTFATWGFVSCATSILSGLVITKIGRIPVFTAAFAIRFGLLIVLLLWVPNTEYVFMFFVLPAVWAIGDGFFLSQLNAMFGTVFTDNPEGAFSCYRFWEGIGLVIGYLLNSVMCVETKIYKHIGILAVGATLYYVFEYVQRQKDKKDALDGTYAEQETFLDKKKSLSALSIENAPVAMVTQATPPRNTFRIKKSLVACTFAYFLCFMGFIGLSVVQSTLVGAVGTIGLGVNFASSIIGCILVAPLIMGLIGTKWCMVLGFAGFLLWMLSNFYPTWGTVIPAAFISGLAFGPMFSGQGAYFAIQSTFYAKITKQNEEDVMAKIFGGFFCLLLMGASIGCLITSAILSAGVQAAMAGVVTEVLNVTLLSTIDNDTMAGKFSHCGASFCPQVAESGINIYTNLTNSSAAIPLEPVGIDPMWIYILVSVHTSFVVIGMILVLLFVDSIPKDESAENVSPYEAAKTSVIMTFKQILRKRMLLCTPLNIYAGMSQSFVLADISEAFITCVVGPDILGYTFSTWGFAACVTSILSGLLMNKTGRISQFTLNSIIRLGLLIFMLVWEPDDKQMVVFFIFPGIWAIGDGFLMSQLNSLYGIVFSDNTEAAFSAYRFWEGVGLVLGYVLNSILCVSHKIYKHIALLIIGTVFYYGMEILNRKAASREKTDEKNRELDNFKDQELVTSSKLTNI